MKEFDEYLTAMASGDASHQESETPDQRLESAVCQALEGNDDSEDDEDGPDLDLFLAGLEIQPASGRMNEEEIESILERMVLSERLFSGFPN